MGALDIAQLPCVGSTGPDGILEGAGTAVFTPRLNYASNLDARFRVYTATGVVDQYSGYRELATSDVDYTALDTILTIPAGSLTTEIAVNIIDDDLVENAEGFQLVARAVENVRDRCQTWAEEADVWIIDDDAPPQISVGDIDVAEDAGIAAFVVSLDRVSASAITVDYATADGSATDPGDYTETAGTVQIDAGLTTAFVEVPLTDDAAPEQDETFTTAAEQLQRCRHHRRRGDRHHQRRRRQHPSAEHQRRRRGRVRQRRQHPFFGDAERAEH